MTKFVKCAMCKSDVSGEACVFAIYKKKIDGKEYLFCCESHAKDFEKKLKKKK